MEKKGTFERKKIFLSNNKHILNYLKNSKPGKIIDVGCGLGWYLSTLNNSWQKYGTDISSFALNNASKYCKTINGDIEKNFKKKKIKQKFDYIIFFTCY